MVGDKESVGSTLRELSAEEIALAWSRELPGVPVSSIPVITALWRTSKTLADERQRTLRRIGMDDATLDLLSTLRRAGAPYTLSTRELSRRCLVSAGAISQRVGRAERDGLVIRRRDPRIVRSVLVALTDAGHERLEPAVAALLHHEEVLVASLDPQDQANLVRLLTALRAAVSRRAGSSA